MFGDNELVLKIRELAGRIGFARVGIAAAGEIKDGRFLTEWLEQGYHADMDYMAANLDKRLQPDLLVDGARSVICLAVGYAPACETAAKGRDYFIARYARGGNYHKILKKRCHNLMDQIRQIKPDFEGRAFVDSAPIAERSLAAAAGLGWIGKNGCLVVPGLGSYVLLCEIVCNLSLPVDSPIESQCRDCDNCLRACPTGALQSNGMVDAKKCISYLTIEHRGEIDCESGAKMNACVFGCDACQESCPHNRDLPPGDAQLIETRPPLAGASLDDILAWTKEDWDIATRGSTMRRATHEMFIRNATIVARNQ